MLNNDPVSLSLRSVEGSTYGDIPRPRGTISASTTEPMSDMKPIFKTMLASRLIKEILKRIRHYFQHKIVVAKLTSQQKKAKNQ